MADKQFDITSETGIQARPAAMLVQYANKFNSDIYLEYNGKKVNLKSIMGVMSLGVRQGTKVIISAEGNDEQEALNYLQEKMNEEGLTK